MRLSLPTKIFTGVALALVWFPSVLVLFLVRLLGLDPATADLPNLLNILLTTLVITDSFRFYTWIGLLLFVVLHTAVSTWQTRRLNLIQVGLVALSTLFIIALVALPAYYVLFVLRDERPAFVEQAGISFSKPEEQRDESEE